MKWRENLETSAEYMRRGISKPNMQDRAWPTHTFHSLKDHFSFDEQSFTETTFEAVFKIVF